MADKFDDLARDFFEQTRFAKPDDALMALAAAGILRRSAAMTANDSISQDESAVWVQAGTAAIDFTGMATEGAAVDRAVRVAELFLAAYRKRKDGMP